MEEKPANVQNTPRGIQEPTILEIKPRQLGKTFAAQEEKAVELVIDEIVRLADLTERPDLDSSPSDHGIDSLGVVELIMNLEDRVGRDFDLDQKDAPSEKSSIRELVAFIAKESV